MTLSNLPIHTNEASIYDMPGIGVRACSDTFEP